MHCSEVRLCSSTLGGIDVSNEKRQELLLDNRYSPEPRQDPIVYSDLAGSTQIVFYCTKVQVETWVEIQRWKRKAL